MWMILGSIVLIFTFQADGQDFIFPKDSSEDGLVTSSGTPQLTERLPIDIPGRCPPNMILYPGDGSVSAWICDCKKDFVYFPLNETCHEVYRQGPCEPDHYVVLPPGEVVPKCEKNPCLTDGLVFYNNTCSELKSNSGPCPKNFVLSINSTNYQLECTKVNIVDLHIIDAPANRCPIGSRRNALGQCRKMI